uniref:Period circadian protein homolog 2 n=1 Tax=Paramormyrops kingsleyae TaxID=1676925 RepID=A0A3B3S9P6_9TELE
MSSFGEGRGRGGPELGLPSEGSESSREPRGERQRTRSLHEDMEMNGSGSSGSGTESHGNESHGNESHGNESHGNESHGNESLGSSNGNCKDSAVLESSGSNKSPSPPSSTNVFSLLSASSEQDNPSTSGCSSEQSAKAKTQKEMFKTLKKLKVHLPSEKRNKGKSSTLNTLKYALRCVKQVKANEEYYQMLMINDSQLPGLDVSSYTIAEIDSITSEYTLKNTDIFAVAVSLITGKIVYISDQATSILNCKRDVFKDAKFVDFLAPQDVSVFYSFTTPYRLPSWSMCTGAESSLSDCMQEKSFFCRISGGRERRGNLQYYPFRMTPYLMKVQDPELAEEQICCLLLAERVHSGYEAPRIPTDKRIFTTTHTPNCLFQDVDERAVPLLGYLPQDLIGTPVLLHLHPCDRPLMLAVHRKILQYMGQPFDHSSIRFCARSGEYVTLDTSWSSFVNPWSRKVSFVIGRHKVRMGPVNEDVFASPDFTEGKIMDSDIQEITEQIHRLLLQPVHSIGSSGYGSLGSNGSHEQLVTVASSSDSSSSSHAPDEARKAKPVSRISASRDSATCWWVVCNCREAGAEQRLSVVRAKEPAPSPSTKENAGAQEEFSYKDQTVYSYQQISCLDSVIRYLESCNVPITVKRKCHSSSNTTSSNSDEDKQKVAPAGLPSIKEPKKPAGLVGASLTPLALPSKPESVVSITSQCSYSSTIVHVGDKKPQPESDVVEGPTPTAAPLAPPSQEREPYKKLGLTKQVLAAHTQKEEQAFLSRCREQRRVRSLQASCSLSLPHQRATPGMRGTKHGGSLADPAPKRGGRNKKTKKARLKAQESSDSTVSHRKQAPRPPLQGLNQTSWSPSETSQSTFPVAYPTVVPAYPLTVYPGSGTMAPGVDAPVPGMGDSQAGQDPCFPMQPPPYTTPLVTPVMAFVMPNYVFPQVGGAPQASFPPQAAFLPQPQFSMQQPFPPQQPLPPHAPFVPQTPFPSQTMFPTPSFPYGLPPEPSKAPSPELRDAPSRCSSPSSAPRDTTSPPLFESRCSSPLQLNLLQLEETTRCGERQDGAVRTGTFLFFGPTPCDAHSSSSDMMDIVLQEDSRSGTGSATSGSLGSGSNGCGSSQTSNTSKYFGSVDSSEHEHKAKAAGGDGEHFMKYVLQDPIWLLMANADESVMMTYQLPTRDMQKVLKEDRERLRQMQKSQPRFSQDQKKELMEVHPWLLKGCLPKAVDVKVGLSFFFVIIVGGT